MSFFEQQTSEVAQVQGYIRTLTFDLQYARTNAQSRALKGLPTSDEPSPEPSSWVAMHEFEEKPGEEVVRRVREEVEKLEGKIAEVQGEVGIWRLERVHGEGRFFD